MKAKKSLKRKRVQENAENENEEEALPPAVRQSDEPIPKKVKWTNKQRVLILAMRGITFLNRHLMQDLQTLLPHSKKDNKIEKGNDNLGLINEIAESKNCNKCILFENRRKSDLYVWFSNLSSGPSAKFLVESVYTMKELKLTGNCLKGSRPLLSFDETFKQKPEYQLLKELFVQIFSTPNHHPKSQPFIDHVITFTIVDHRIWFRNYQILSQDGALTEIGPRFVLNPIKIFAGSFGGEVLWENSHFVSTAAYRRQLSKVKGNRYIDRKQQKEHYDNTKPENTYDDLEHFTDIFHEDPLEQAQEIIENMKSNKKKKRKMKS